MRAAGRRRPRVEGAADRAKHGGHSRRAARGKRAPEERHAPRALQPIQPSSCKRIRSRPSRGRFFPAQEDAGTRQLQQRLYNTPRGGLPYTPRRTLRRGSSSTTVVTARETWTRENERTPPTQPGTPESVGSATPALRTGRCRSRAAAAARPAGSTAPVLSAGAVRAPGATPRTGAGRARLSSAMSCRWSCSGLGSTRSASAAAREPSTPCRGWRWSFRLRAG